MDYEYKVVRIMPMLAGPKYGDESPDSTRSMLVELLSEQYRRRNQSVTPDSLAVTSGYLDDDIREYYGISMTSSEARLAMEWGLHGEFGEFTGLNADRLFRFVKSYAESPERQEAVKRVKASRSPDRSGGPTPEEIGRRNWDAMLDYAIQTYGEYRTFGRLPGTHPETAEGLAGALVVAQRHCEACCYRWLKAVGVVMTDADTFATEVEMEARAAKRLELPADDPRVRTLADAMMLELLFLTAGSAGFDFPARMAELAETPEGERRFWR